MRTTSKENIHETSEQKECVATLACHHQQILYNIKCITVSLFASMASYFSNNNHCNDNDDDNNDGSKFVNRIFSSTELVIDTHMRQTKTMYHNNNLKLPRIYNFLCRNHRCEYIYSARCSVVVFVCICLSMSTIQFIKAGLFCSHIAIVCISWALEFSFSTMCPCIRHVFPMAFFFIGQHIPKMCVFISLRSCVANAMPYCNLHA